MKVKEEAVSSSSVIGEYGESDVMKLFSIRQLEEQVVDSKEQFKVYEKAFKEWKGNHKIKKCGVRRGVAKSLYSPGDPPFPGADVSTSDIMSLLAYGEYWEKPYDQEKLAQLGELSSSLKSNISAYSRETVGLDTKYIPSKRRKLYDFTEEELVQYHIQGKDMLNWIDVKSGLGIRFCKIARQHMAGKEGIGEGYLETIRNGKDVIVSINFVSAQPVFELKSGLGYIWTRNGTKKYYKKFGDTTRYNKYTFEKGGKLKDSATELIPYKRMCEISSIYGIPRWSPNIPGILGDRYSDERNVNYFLNDAMPKMAILISGGRVDNDTLEDVKKFFRQGKGREHYGRALVLCVSGKNTLAGTKVPTIKLEPLGLGVTEDAGFLKYKAVTASSIREAFQQAGIFLGSTGDSNRASSFTLRDMTVTGSYLPESKDYATLINETLVVEYAKEKKIDDLLVELAFVLPRTMSEKDWLTHQLEELRAGATTINDYRSSIGLDRINKWWAEISAKLIVPSMQMAALVPEMVESLTGYDEFKPDSSEEGTQKSLSMIRKALTIMTTQPSKRISKETFDILDKWFVNEEDE